MPGPFAGLRVIEIGRFIAVPYCGQLFADGGADLVKVESLDGDESRANGPIIPGEGRQFLNKNRGKRSVALDFRAPEAQQAIVALLSTADVALINQRPGQPERFGFGWEQMHALNPRLIYADVSAFGSLGEDRMLPGMDQIIQARSGLSAALNVAVDGQPSPAPLALSDYGCALLVSFGVSAALYVRERTGVGQRVQTSLLAAAMVLQNSQITYSDRYDDWRGELLEWLTEARRDGVPYEAQLDKRADARFAGGTGALYSRCYGTSDGFIALAASTPTLRRRLLDELGIDDPRVRDPAWQPENLRAHFEEQRARIRTAFLDDSTPGWLERLRKVGVPCAEVRFPEEMVDDAQALANGLIVTLEHPRLGTMRLVGPPVQLSDTPMRAGATPPRLGEHTRQLLGEAGLSAGQIERLIAAGLARETESYAASGN